MEKTAVKGVYLPTSDASDIYYERTSANTVSPTDAASPESVMSALRDRIFVLDVTPQVSEMTPSWEETTRD